MSDPVYIFLDESGDLGFTNSGSRFFVLTSVVMQRPFLLYKALDDLRYTCLEEGAEFEYFHCANNTRQVRNRLFDILETTMTGSIVDSLIVNGGGMLGHWGVEVQGKCPVKCSAKMSLG